MDLQAHQRRRFWQDTLETDRATCVVYYSYGWLIPVVYVRGGRRVYPASSLASLYMGPDAADQREWMMGLISQALGQAVNGAVSAKATDPVMEKQCPTLFAFMTETEEDGKPRSPSSLVVFTEDGLWKACLSEKDASLQLWRTGETFQKLLGALEKALASGNADWRKKWTPGAKEKPPRGKR